MRSYSLVPHFRQNLSPGLSLAPHAVQKSTAFADPGDAAEAGAAPVPAGAGEAAGDVAAAGAGCAVGAGEAAGPGAAAVWAGAAAADASDVPQWMQNFTPGLTVFPQTGQIFPAPACADWVRAASAPAVEPGVTSAAVSCAVSAARENGKSTTSMSDGMYSQVMDLLSFSVTPMAPSPVTI